MQFEEIRRNEVEAIQYTGTNAREVIDAAGGKGLLVDEFGTFKLFPDGKPVRTIHPGDWLIYLVEGMPARRVLTNDEMMRRYRPTDGAWCDACGAAIEADDMGGGIECDLCPACLAECEADSARIAATTHGYQAFRVRYTLDGISEERQVVMAESMDRVNVAIDRGDFGKWPVFNVGKLPLDQAHEYTRTDYPCRITLDMAIKHELDSLGESGRAQLERLGWRELPVEPAPVEAD